MADGEIATGYSNSNIPNVLLNGKFQNIITVAKTGTRANFVTGGTYTTDTACIQAALNYILNLGGGVLWIMAGHYNITSQLSYLGNNLIIMGQGDTTILDFTNCPASPATYFTVGGSITTATSSNLSSNANEQTSIISVADGSKFTAGQWIRISSTELLISDADATWTQQLGEIQQIDSIAGNDITIKERLHATYKTSYTAKVELVDMKENVQLSDIKILGANGVDHVGISIHQVYGVKLERVNFDDCYKASTFFTDVVNLSVENCTFSRSNMAGWGYGIAVIDACRDINISNCKGYDCRHVICSSGNHGPGVQYNQVWSCIIGEHSSQNQVMLGPHPCYNGLTVTGCTTNGMGLGFFNGLNATVVDNEINSITSTGISLPSTSRGTKVRGNRIHVLLNHGITVRTEFEDNEISGNTIVCDTSGYDGISIAGQFNDSRIFDNKITTVGHGINLTSYGGIKETKRVRISGNTVTSSEEAGINVECVGYAISKLRIYDNEIEAHTHGIQIDQSNVSMSKLYVSRNEITMASTHSTERGIYFSCPGTATFTEVDILGNIIHGAWDSIEVERASKIHISGNKIYDAAESGLIIHNTVTYYEVTENLFENCVGTITNNAGITGRIVENNRGYNPTGAITSPSVSASGGSGTTNNFGYNCAVCVTGGTVTGIAVDGVTTGLTSGMVIVPRGKSIVLTYTVAPDWTWCGL